MVRRNRWGVKIGRRSPRQRGQYSTPKHRLIGALTESGVSEDDAHVYAEGVRRGGTLVTAKVDESLQAEAEAILRKSNWVDPGQRRAVYANEGWTRFDDTLDPYGSAEVEQERLRYRR